MPRAEGLARRSIVMVTVLATEIPLRITDVSVREGRFMAVNLLTGLPSWWPIETPIRRAASARRA